MRGKLKGPGPKVFITLTITVFVIVSSIAVSAYRNRNPKQSNIVVENRQGSVVKVNNNLRGIYTNLDSDGLLSWEKVLNTTTPKNLIVDDELDYISDIKTDPNSFTSEIGLEAMQEILMSLSNPNSSLDADALMEKIGRAGDEQLTYKDRYSRNQMFIVESSEENIKNYINNLATVATEEVERVIPSAEYLLSIPTERDFVVIMSDVYKNTATRMSTYSVPEIFAGIHTEYLNNLDATTFYTKIMLNEQNDPLLAYIATPKLDESMNNLEKLFTQIMAYPINNGIIFNEDDPAYEFYNEQ